MLFNVTLKIVAASAFGHFRHHYTNTADADNNI